MKKQEKYFEIQNLASKIQGSKGVYLFDYRGLNAPQTADLKQKIKQAGGSLQVVKNTLFYRALTQTGYQIEKKHLDGPTMALFAEQEEIAPLKALVSFSKSSGLLSLKLGLVANQVYQPTDLNRLATIPPLNILQSQLVNTLATPLSKLAYSLNWNLQKLVLVINEIKNKKQ